MRAKISLAAITLALATPAYAQSNNPACDPDKKFFLTGSIVGAGYGLCVAHSSVKSARLSFERDHVADTSDGEVSATLAWKFFPPRTFGNLDVSGLAYVSADGHFDSADGPNEVRAGAYAELAQQFIKSGRDGNWFLSYGLGVFALSDFKGTASGYGLTASFIPVFSSDRLGLNYLGEAGHPYLIARADLDALSVNQGGKTAYADDTNYAFLSATVGLGYGVKNKFDLSLEHTLGRNLVDDYSYSSTIAELSIPLAIKGNAELSLRHKRQEDRVTLKTSKTSTITLDFNF